MSMMWKIWTGNTSRCKCPRCGRYGQAILAGANVHDVEAQKRNISSDPTCKNVHFNPWRVHGGYMVGTWQVYGGYMAGT